MAVTTEETEKFEQNYVFNCMNVKNVAENNAQVKYFKCNLYIPALFCCRVQDPVFVT